MHFQLFELYKDKIPIWVSWEMRQKYKRVSGFLKPSHLLTLLLGSGQYKSPQLPLGELPPPSCPYMPCRVGECFSALGFSEQGELMPRGFQVRLTCLCIPVPPCGHQGTFSVHTHSLSMHLLQWGYCGDQMNE